MKVVVPNKHKKVSFLRDNPKERFSEGNVISGVLTVGRLLATSVGFYFILRL